MEEQELNDIERKILNRLYARRSWASTLAVAKLSGISWETADSYLRELFDNEFVEYKSLGKKDEWRFNFKKWRQLRKMIYRK